MKDSPMKKLILSVAVLILGYLSYGLYQDYSIYRELSQEGCQLIESHSKEVAAGKINPATGQVYFTPYAKKVYLCDGHAIYVK